MVVIDKKNVLSGLKVSHAMRRVVAGVRRSAAIGAGIRILIKFAINVMLITEYDSEAIGTVPKSNIVDAYYASLPLETPLDVVMIPGPVFRHKGDTLEAALDCMKSHRIRTLYVYDEEPRQAVGALSYEDVLGLLYRYCHRCERNTLRADASRAGGKHLRVGEVMTISLDSYPYETGLHEVIEGLDANRSEAALIFQDNGKPVGVLSKTDLLLAYLHSVSPDTEAGCVMSRPIRSCAHDEYLLPAIQRMIFTDVQRLFVYKGSPENIVGMLSLSDAARARSGSCGACLSSRILVEWSRY